MGGAGAGHDGDRRVAVTGVHGAQGRARTGARPVNLPGTDRVAGTGPEPPVRGHDPGWVTARLRPNGAPMAGAGAGRRCRHRRARVQNGTMTTGDERRSSSRSARTGRRGPRPGTGRSARDDIAAAARAEFAERGFGGATIRSIASRAGVDPALVHHYFGTKMDLFREVLALDVDPVRTVLPEFLDGPREQAGARIARAFLNAYEEPSFREPVLALIRSAMTDGEIAMMASSFLQEAMLPAVTGLGLGPDRQRHGALAMTHLVGIVLGRHLMRLEALQGPVDELVAEVAPIVQRYLDDTNTA